MVNLVRMPPCGQDHATLARLSKLPSRADPTTSIAPSARRPVLSVVRCDRRSRCKSAVVLVACALALVALAVKDPRTYGLGPLCPTNRFLGIYCPGCGSTRASYDLLHGQFASAIRNNPLIVVLGVPLIAWIAACESLALFRGAAPRIRLPIWAQVATLIVIVAFGVARNIPVSAMEFLRPPAVSSP